MARGWVVVNEGDGRGVAAGIDKRGKWEVTGFAWMCVWGEGRDEVETMHPGTRRQEAGW